jgi:hypothetical protein
MLAEVMLLIFTVDREAIVIKVRYLLDNFEAVASILGVGGRNPPDFEVGYGKG